MSNKNSDSEPITAEKIHNNYPQITLLSEASSKSSDNSNNDCGTNSLTVISTKVPVTATAVTKATIPFIKKTTSPVVDKKVPPYVNALPHDPVRVSKIPVQKPFTKAVPKVATEKILISSEQVVTSNQGPVIKVSSSGDVKKPQNQQCARANFPQTVTKSVDKVVLSNSPTPAEENKSSSGSEGESKNTEKPTTALSTQSTQIQCKTTNVFEKNINRNVISFTPRTVTISLSTTKATPSKDIKNAETNTVNVSKSVTSTLSPSTPKSTQPKPPILSTESLCKNIPKSVSIQNIESPKIINRSINANSNSKNDLTNNLKPLPVEASMKNTSKIVIVTSADTSMRTKSPSPSISSSPKIQTYESFAIPPAPTIKTGKSNQLPGNLQIASLTEVEKNKDIIKAINSGSTASVGENVTISSSSSSPAEYVLVALPTPRSTPDSKIRNVSSETTIETITKQASNPGSPAQRNKNGNSTENVGQSSKQDSSSSSRASSPGEIRTPKRNEISGSTDEGENSNDCVNLDFLKKKMEEPVECLTISSDEETEPEQFGSSDNSDISLSISNKEPPIERDDEVSNKSLDNIAFEKEIDTMLEITTGDGFTNVICRTVRIGSYKIKPRNGVTISKYGLKIVVPPLNNSNDSVAVKIPIHDITKVLVHYNRSLPVIFYYVTPQAGAKIRQTLKMHDSNYYYFDPNSLDESHRRITLLPEKFSDDDKIEISTYYLNRDVLDELTHVEANQLLVKSAPKEIQKTVRLPPNPVQTIMVYPPPPAKGGISINTEDYSCLAEDTYLNDVIIDFYLKYLYQERLSEEDRQKTHIFSSFFYKRLTDKATPVPRMLQNSKSNDTVVTPAEIRHDRVKKWTKNIDIFSKDYIIIPLNENQHWFLAIICFPGLTGPVKYSDNTPIDLDSSKKTEDVKNENSNCSEKEPDTSQTRRIGSTTITPVSGRDSYTLADEEGDLEDRDEADGADEDVDELFTSDEDSDDPYSDPELGEIGDDDVTPKKKPDREPIKQPCILIFDSLKSASRARIIATLREYLHVEYKTKHNGEERDFSKNVVKGACPKVPQQTNYTDCGLYVLQYVETFFDDKITDFNIPIRTLGRWFTAEVVSYKRYHIQRLLHQLMQDQKINVNALHLPELNLSPRYHYDSDCMDEYEEGYYDDDEEEEEEDSGLDHLVCYEEEIEEHEDRMRRYMDEDIEYGEEEDMEGGESRYAVFDTADESSSNDDFSDDDDAYKDLDDLEMASMPSRQRRTLIRVTRDGDGPDDEEILHEEEEEIEEGVEIDDEEEFSRLSNLNKENVTISRMPAGSGGGAVVMKSQSAEAKSSTLEELKSARPWKKLNEVSIERATEDDCPTKKFKTN